MILRELIQRLQALEEKEGGDLLVFATHGASGVSTELGYPSFSERDEWDNGDTLNLEMGEKYVSIYAGN